MEAERPVNAEDFAGGAVSQMSGHGEKGSGLANMLKGVHMAFAD